MFATIRRYDSVDEKRTQEIVKQLDASLVPKLSKLPGFRSYYLVDAGEGVISSISLFDTNEHAAKSAEVAAQWVRDENFGPALPNPPKVTTGEIVVEKTAELVQA